MALDIAVEVEIEPSEDGYRVRQGNTLVEAGTSAELADTPETALVGLILDELGAPPVEVRVTSGSPRGGGLGASSALAVATIAAGEAVLGKTATTAEARASLAQDLEARLMSVPTGCQDHFPALYGGVLELQLEPGGLKVRQIKTDLEALAESLLVVYSGQTHFSAGHNWRVIRNRFEADKTTIRCFDGIRDVAAEIVVALEGGRLQEVGELMSREWGWRRQLAEGVSTPKIEELLGGAVAAGAWGGKACGAGGGGCLAILCPRDARSDVENAVTLGGGQILPARPANEPLLVRSLDGSIR